MRSSFLAFVGLSFIGSVFGTNADNDDPVETAFEDLKEQLCGRKKAPFYVICVMRSGNDPLSRVDLEFLKAVLQKLLQGQQAVDVEQRLKQAVIKIMSKDYMSLATKKTGISQIQPEQEEEAFNKHNSLARYKSDFKIQKRIKSIRSNENCSQEEAINLFIQRSNYKQILEKYCPLMKNNISDCPGFVIFNEYFFYGGDDKKRIVVPTNLVKHFSKCCSKIDRTKIWMFNFLQKRKVLTINQDSIYDKFNLYIQQKRCTTSIESLRYPQFTELVNQTMYAIDGRIAAVYNKSTYCEENDSFLKKHRGFYDFGEWKLVRSPSADTSVFECLSKNIQPCICADYPYMINQVRNGKTKFLIVQSNTTPLSFDSKRRQHDGQLLDEVHDIDNSKYPEANYPFTIHCDPSLINNVKKKDNKRTSLSGVFLYSDRGKIKAKKPKYTAKFNIYGVTYYIEVYKVD